MRAPDFFRGMRATQALLSELQLLHHPQSYGSLRPSDAFLRRALAGDCKYPSLFLTGLQNRDFNFLLIDFSYFQFAFEETGGHLELRYAFYPNPFEVVSFEQFCDDYLIDVAEPNAYEDYLQYLEGLEEWHRVPPFRYEVSYRQYQPLVHPTAHLHIGLHSENRWPVERVLSPTAFVLLMAKMFYGGAWKTYGEAGGGQNAFDRRLSEEKAKCAVLAEQHFSALEREQVFIS